MAVERFRRHWAQGRTLHLIDVENLVRGSGASAAEVARALAGAAELRRVGVVVVVVSLGESLAIDLRDNAVLVRRLPAAAPV